MPSSAVPQLASKVPPWLGVGVGVGVAAQGLTLGLAWGLGLRGAWAYFSERIPPNDAGVAAALAEYADAPVDRECAADRRAGERAGYTVCVCVCVQPAAEPRAGRVREHWHGVLGHTLQPQPAPLAVNPASRQLRPQSAANSSLGHACGWQLKPRPCVRLAMGRGASLVSMIARGVDRAFLSSHCRSVYPRRPAGGLSSSRRPSRSSSRAHCDRGGPGLRRSGTR